MKGYIIYLTFNCVFVFLHLIEFFNTAAIWIKAVLMCVEFKIYSYFEHKMTHLTVYLCFYIYIEFLNKAISIKAGLMCVEAKM